MWYLSKYQFAKPFTRFHRHHIVQLYMQKTKINMNLASTTTQAEKKFSQYYEKWIKQLEDHLQQIVALSSSSTTRHPHSNIEPPTYETIVSNLKTHYKDYYKQKWSTAHEDVLIFYSQPWLTPLENSYLWITGWKPSMVFKLVDSLRGTRVPVTSLAHMTDDQVKKMEELRAKIKFEEEKIEREMERQQVVMGDGKTVGLARLCARVGGGGGGDASEVVDGLVGVTITGLLVGLERVMKGGDCVRLKTLKGVLDLLSSKQCVDFLAVFSMIQIQHRKRGNDWLQRPSSSVPAVQQDILGTPPNPMSCGTGQNMPCMAPSPT